MTFYFSRDEHNHVRSYSTSITQRRILNRAALSGWQALWSHKLLTLIAESNGTRYLVQVLFSRDGYWEYALAFYRQGTYESKTRVIARVKDLFEHLASPS